LKPLRAAWLWWLSSASKFRLFYLFGYRGMSASSLFK
jgi:hypothetical protein